jgi:hypothetical protein
MVCEFCWAEATRRAASSGKPVSGEYNQVILEAGPYNFQVPWHPKPTVAPDSESDPEAPAAPSASQSHNE